MSTKRIAVFKYGQGTQRGAALLIMLVLLVVGIAAILINSLTTAAAKNARQENTAAALAQAKEALIGYAITYGDTHSNAVHGYLPCPDTSGSSEGSKASSCGTNPNVSVIGRLPWRTLGLPTLRDGNGECLWYAVSGTYKDSPKTGLMNWDTDGQLQAYASDGTLLTPAGNQVVAAIFAPGAAQTGQDRSGTTAPVCGGNYTASNYLDNDTTHSINNWDIAAGKFIQGTSGGSVNDQMLFITRQDIWNAVQNRTDFQNQLKLLTQQVTLCLAHYGNSNKSCGFHCSNNSLPWPAPLAFPVGSDYSVNANYNDSANLYAGRAPYDVSTSMGTPSHSNLSSPLLTATNCGAGWTTSIDAWWNNWKDHLFYGLAGAYQPTSSGGQGCGFSQPCLSINGSGHYAAVVMFANSRIGSQVRTSNTISTSPITSNRGNISNYLEGNNASSYSTSPYPPSGNENYQTGASSTFNDVLCSIDQFLNVNCP